MSDNQLRGKKLSGDLKGRLVGSAAAVMSLGNITTLKSKQEVETDTLISTGRVTYGQAIESDNTPKPMEISFSFNTFNKDAMARTLMGEAVDLENTVKDFTDEEQAVSFEGEVKLVYDDIDPDDFVVKDATGGDVDAKHYKLNAEMGLIAFIDSDEMALTKGDTVTITGKTKGSAGFHIDANTLQSYALELWLDGEDRITEKRFSLHIPHVVLSADGDIDWMSTDWWESGLTGTVVTDEAKYPFRYKEFA